MHISTKKQQHVFVLIHCCSWCMGRWSTHTAFFYSGWGGSHRLLLWSVH